jgi:3D (Asp-Asp-Asp) domain-containing protein
VGTIPETPGQGGSSPSSPAPDRGRLIGTFVHTYYWMEFESKYPGTADTELHLIDCSPAALVTEAFAQRVCVEGTGRLLGGQLLNLSGECSCGHLCQETGATVCFFMEDGARAEWGYGSDGNELVPLRSLAVDEAEIPHGTLIYIPEWDGIEMPSSDGLGGFVHDGCFRADDIGYGINGLHYDVYTGTDAMWTALEPLVPTNSDTTLYSSPRRCGALRRP